MFVAFENEEVNACDFDTLTKLSSGCLIRSLSGIEFRLTWLSMHRLALMRLTDACHCLTDVLLAASMNSLCVTLFILKLPAL